VGQIVNLFRKSAGPIPGYHRGMPNVVHRPLSATRVFLFYLSRLFLDARYAIRLLRKDAAFATLAVLSLALGIASCTAVFSIFNGLFLRSLPYPNAERLVHLQEAVPSRNIGYRPIALMDLHAWEASGAFSQIAGFHEDGSYLTGFGQAVRVNVKNVTQSLAATLGIEPILGRDFLPEEDRGGSPWFSTASHRVALLSYGLWQRHFAGAADAVGKTVRLDNLPFTVVGVLPRNAVYPADADVWVLGAYGDANNPGYVHHGVGRLKPGVTLGQATADLMRIQKGTVAARPNNRFIDPVVASLRESYLGDYKTVSRILLGAVGFVLLIACLNVSGLTLARRTARAHEFAIRSALGAGRGTLIRQLLAEGLLLACAGAVAGASLGWVAVRVMLSFIPGVLPSWVDFGVDQHFLWFALAVTGIVTILSTLTPAFELSKIGTGASLTSGGPRSSPCGRTRHGMNLLVAGEIAAALVLLTGGALVLKAFYRVASVAPGFQPDSALTFSVDPPGVTNDPDYARRRVRYAEDLLSRLRSTPGIEAAGMTDGLPLSATRVLITSNIPLQAEGAPPPDPSAPLLLVAGRRVTPGYFRALGVPLLDGRDFDEHDAVGAAIVNETLARRYWPSGGSMIGKRLLQPAAKLWFTVVGVVADVRDDGLEQPVRPQIFGPYPAAIVSYLNIVARGRLDSASLVASAREAARQADPDVAIFDVQTMRDLLDRSLGERRAYTWLFGVFAAIALVIAVAGTYGVVSYAVTQRTREIGIRMALGAQPRQVIREVLRGGLTLVGAGAVIGLAGAWFAARLMTSLLAGVSAHDPQAYLSVIAVLVVAGLLATFFPARRAASVDPVQALKFD
jgi:predicted permease